MYKFIQIVKKWFLSLFRRKKRDSEPDCFDEFNLALTEWLLTLPNSENIQVRRKHLSENEWIIKVRDFTQAYLLFRKIPFMQECTHKLVAGNYYIQRSSSDGNHRITLSDKVNRKRAIAMITVCDEDQRPLTKIIVIKKISKCKY